MGYYINKYRKLINSDISTPSFSTNDESEKSERSEKSIKKLVTKALMRKQGELEKYEKYLTSSFVLDTEWDQKQIKQLSIQIGSIKRFLSQGGDLDLPVCCKDNDRHCLIAMYGFEFCLLEPISCGFNCKRL